MLTPYQRMFGSGPCQLGLALACAVAAVKLQGLFPLPRLELALPLRLFLTAGILIIGGAVILRCFTVLPLHRRGREFVTSGPYQYVRHPLYTAIFLTTGLSVLFVVQTFWAVAATAFMFLAGRLIVGYEEKLMERRFGQQWLDYGLQTPRFFPRVFRR